MQGTARAPGTCGELVQGKINGINFLVTCPVDLYSVVTVGLNNHGFIEVDESLTKVKLAVEKTLHYLERPEMGAEVQVTTDIPWGKGMASSSADIAAACAAVAVALGTYLTPDEIANIALSIEPTDGVMFPGITIFDHVEGKMRRCLGQAPEIEILVVDLGGMVDTVAFNANAELELLNKAKEHKVTAAVDKVEKALDSGEFAVLGQAATESAFAHQHILFKPELEYLSELCCDLGGIGVNIAHSGTVVGLLFEKGKINGSTAEFLAAKGFNRVLTARVIDGGVDVFTERAGEAHWLPLSTYMEATYGKLRRSTG